VEGVGQVSEARRVVLQGQFQWRVFNQKLTAGIAVIFPWSAVRRMLTLVTVL
jgi:hypothetical protein